MNLWHEISRGNKIPELINVIVEIPAGSNNKYEIDKKTGLISLDRANYTSSAYPFDYGFVPQTLWDDNDPLDVVILTTFPLYPGILVQVRPIAVIEMIDDGESDYKVIGVPNDDRRWEDTHDLQDISNHRIKEISHFFRTYKQLKKDGEEVQVEIRGVKGRDEAINAIKKSIETYDKKYGSPKND
ncbi:MAG TPA: inorganic diphosphatase [Candidatus Paceibacterota bacterium]|nr:inorganic diphosphatase [Candidatus Paceibacterota bacterium]